MKDNSLMYLGIAAAAYYLLSRSRAQAVPMPSADVVAAGVTGAVPSAFIIPPGTDTAPPPKPVTTITDNPVPDGWYPNPSGGSILYQDGKPVAITQGGFPQPTPGPVSDFQPMPYSNGAPQWWGGGNRPRLGVIKSYEL